MSEEEPIIRPNWNQDPSVRGSRLSVYNIMEFHLAGDKPDEIAGVFGISVGDAQAAVEYIELHREELLPVYNTIIERHRRGNPPEIEAKLAKSHEKFMSLKAQLESENSDAAKVGSGDSRLAG
jgi:hypothetical protein